MAMRIARIIDNAKKSYLKNSYTVYTMEKVARVEIFESRREKKVKCEIIRLQNRKSPGLLMNATGVKKVEHCRTLGDLGT